MAKISEDVQTFIVQRLAMFDSPSKVAAAVKQEFGLELSRQQVEIYNPGRAGKKPAEKWCVLHAETRKRFLEKVTDQPSSHRAVRIERLERMAMRLEEKAIETKSPALAAQLIKGAVEIYELIAKEVGELLTNHRILSITDPDKELSKLAGVPIDQLPPPGDTSTATDGEIL